MRLKKHLDERLQAVQNVLLLQEGYDFYKLTTEQKQALAINLDKAFATKQNLCLELGCGKGAFALQFAQKNPNKNIIALEKLSNVIVVACEDAMQRDCTNLRFLNCRAENLLWYLPKHSVDEIYLNFSCPFPKKTYANRRLTSKNFLETYKQLLTTNGVIYQKTDDLAFFDWSIQSLTENGFEVFDVTNDLPNDANNILTEYESKFRSIGKKINALKAKVKVDN